MIEYLERYHLTAKLDESEKTGLLRCIAKLPENVKFLSVLGGSYKVSGINIESLSFSVSFIKDFNCSTKDQKYEFLVIPETVTNVVIDEYTFLASAKSYHTNSIETQHCIDGICSYDVFYIKIS